MKKYPAEEPDPFRDIKDWQDHRYDPGYFTGGNIHPLLKARRPNKYGYFLIVSGLAFSFVAHGDRLDHFNYHQAKEKIR